MPARRILFVKLSSLGDVIHHLPAVTDLARERPGSHVAWAVEPGYADLVRLHPAVDEAIPVGLRALRAGPHRAGRWGGILASRRALAAGRWDYIVDTQGLLKSALVALAARGARFGYDKASARERIASRFYDVRIAVPRTLHAVERNRLLVAHVFGYAVKNRADYGLVPPPRRPDWAPQGEYAVLLHAASRREKLWSEDKWKELGRRLADLGCTSVLPGGTENERKAAARLAAAIPGAIAAPALDLATAAGLLGHAGAVVGVDTGLTHLGVALGRLTIGIYRATDPALTGLHGENGVSLGGRGGDPAVDEVIAALGVG